jgi:glyoxylase-like metal-dependent hydrolase (beta-lactamase superfamily II)
MKHGNMIVESRPVGPFAMNSYVVGCAETRDGAVIDSGGETEEILELAAAHDLKIVKLLQTHGHLDHVAGLQQMKAATGAPIYLHPAALPIYSNASMAGRMFGIPVQNPPPPDAELAEGDILELGELRLSVLFTPGHSPGHVCFHVESVDVLFGGDLIFQSSIGRIDLPGADPEAMKASLDRVMRDLTDETVIYPGHMGDTTIGRERRTNPFLNRAW